MNYNMDMTIRLLNAVERKSNEFVEEIVDIGLRHKSPGAKPYDYLKQWLTIARCFAYATHDDSWGEFEKEFAIIIRNYLELKLENNALKKAIKAIRNELEIIKPIELDERDEY